MIRTALGKILTAKAAAVVAATTIGGVAVAAGTGNLPTSHDTEASSHSQAAETGETSETGPQSSKSASAKASPHAAAGTPSPSMVGLCRAYAAGMKTDHGKALDSPAFKALVTAAGGTAKVSGWCTTLLAQQKAAQQKAEHPAPAGSPTQTHSDHPSAGQHPGGPTAHPTGSPTSHPTPTATPTEHAP